MWALIAASACDQLGDGTCMMMHAYNRRCALWVCAQKCTHAGGDAYGSRHAGTQCACSRNAGGRSRARKGARTLCITLATLCAPGCIFGVLGLLLLPKLYYG